MTKRTERLNSLLKEVISEVIRKQVRNPKVAQFTTVTGVDISKDLHHAKVYVSVIGTDQERSTTVEALETAAGFIGVHSSKKVVMRHFPSLTFRLDTSVDNQLKIDSLIKKIHTEEKTRKSNE